MERSVVGEKNGFLRRTQRGNSVGGKGCVVADAGQRARQVLQLRVLVIEADADGKLGFAHRARGHVDGGQARRHDRPAQNLVPVEAQARFEKQAGARRPPVLHIRAGFGIVAGEGSGRGKSALPQQRSILAQIADRSPRNGFVEADLIQVDAGFQIVQSSPVTRRQIERGVRFNAL